MSEDNKQAAEARAAAVAALEEEKRGYERRGLKERASQVDAELAKLTKAPKGRSSKTDDKA